MAAAARPPLPAIRASDRRAVAARASIGEGGGRRRPGGEEPAVSVSSFEPGLIIHRASRVERLAEQLAATLEACPPAQPLAAQEIVVAHPGLGSWLLQRLARRRGADGSPGIAANLRFLLPGEWLLGLAERVLPAAAQPAAPWPREALRWRLVPLLTRSTEATLRRYLAGDCGGRLAFQLADQLAGLYARYQLYRPDWIAAAETGRETHWQARLWRELAAEIGAPHRAAATARLLPALAAGAFKSDAPLHLFGLNHLPPDGFGALQALAPHAAIHLYFADPCAAYWHDLYSERALARALSRGAGEHAETGHALLAALGRHGQGFNQALERIERLDDRRDPDDEAEPTGGPLLDRLQQSIRLLDEALLDGPASTADASLRLHACHTRLRELEVLRDALLDRLAADASLRPADIVVMAPDIGAYAALIPAVFGAAGQYQPGEPGQLPYRIADRRLGAEHPLLATFLQLLELPASRLERDQLLGLLAVPALARAFALGDGDRAALEAWLRRSRVQWGFDGPARQAAGAVDRPEHSWSWALDRMLLGLMVGADPAFDGWSGIQPVAPLDGPDADLLGRLRQLLRQLDSGRRAMAGLRPVSDWSRWLLGWVEGLFVADPADRPETAALATLKAAIGSLAQESERAGVDPELGWPAIAEALRGALDGPPLQPRFLEGGMTFCGMVPARVVPFRVVAILGLDEQAFPRPPAGPGLDLMAAAPRAGDRDSVDEDRYLFLECLMAARDALHLSWCGEGVADGHPRNPAAPLAELQALLARRLGTSDDPPWLLRHALQPFDARYFGARAGDPRWFSFAAAYAAATPGAEPGRRPAGLLDGQPLAASSAHDPLPEAPLALAELRRFLRSPLRHYSERRLRLRLDVLDEDDAAVESFAPKAGALDRLELQLLERALWRGEPIDPRAAPAWLAGAGLLPLGAPGEAAYRRAARLAAAAEQRTRDTFGPTLATACSQPLRLLLDQRAVLLGSVQPVLEVDGVCVLPAWRFGDGVGGRQLLPLFLDWAALCLSLPAERPPPQARLLVVGLRKGRLQVDWSSQAAAWSEGAPAAVRARADTGLRYLLAAYRAGSELPWPLLPYTSWAYADSADARREQAARQAWAGGNGGERSYCPPYPRFLFGADGPFAGEALQANFAATALELAALLAPEPAP